MPTAQNKPIAEIPLSSTARFIASDTISSSLQPVLVDLIELNLQASKHIGTSSGRTSLMRTGSSS